MSKVTIFSGIQPSGNLHIGNYIGMISQMVAGQNTRETMLLGIVDLHAITVHQDPKVLREKCMALAALYIACGIDPKLSKILIQSENPDHSYLAWIFDCITPMGWMERMIQFKEKSYKQGERTSVGLFNYPVLMAADILLYDSPYVPVGEDQTQHIEFTRDIAERFNNIYCHPNLKNSHPELVSGSGSNDLPAGKAGMPNQVRHDSGASCIFTLPKAKIIKESARIMSLQNPMNKMSKSDADPSGTINLLDTEDEIRKKVKRAVTDSGTEIEYSNGKPALSNLLTIYSKLSGKPIDAIEAMYKNKGYADFKTDLAEVVVSALKPIQKKYHEIRQDKGYLDKVLNEGITYAKQISGKKINQVKNAIGLGRFA